MPMTKSRGNMYGWVTHTHSHIGGECPHKCSYCYVDNPRFGRPARYTGPLRLIEAELLIEYGSGRTIFVEHMNDLFAEDVPAEWIVKVLEHCCKWTLSRFVFQTKNPGRLACVYRDRIPVGSIVGTTIETNRHWPQHMGSAPRVHGRQFGMLELRQHRPDLTRFVTIEPIMVFDLAELVSGIVEIAPAFVNIGADSKGRGLPEPTGPEVAALIQALQGRGIEIRKKTNLSRLVT